MMEFEVPELFRLAPEDFASRAENYQSPEGDRGSIWHGEPIIAGQPSATIMLTGKEGPGFVTARADRVPEGCWITVYANEDLWQSSKPLWDRFYSHLQRRGCFATVLPEPEGLMKADAVIRPPVPAAHDQGGSGKDWIAYFHALKAAGLATDLKVIAKEGGFSWSYLRQLHAGCAEECCVDT
jgi:hypothetical protein